MDCFDTRQLFAFAQGEMGAEAAVSVEQHLDSCAVCRALVAEAARAPSGARTAPSSPPHAASGPVHSWLERGALLGRYVVLERIGAGGMGVVHAAYDPELDRRVALKLIRIDAVSPAKQEQAQARLLREAQATARVVHPNVITIHDVGRFGEHVFLAMELVDGTTLREHMHRQRGPGRWRELLGLFLQAGRGLAAAHAQGLVHRDFKPDNVLVGRDGRVRITDFGLARIIEGMDDAREPASGDLRHGLLTRSDLVLGTPAYMAPEQTRGELSDARSDQYSYCVALHEALYGKRPSPPAQANGTGGEEVKRASGPRPPRDSGVPAWVHRAILQGLSESPEARHASMDVLLRRLSAAPGAKWRRAGVAVAAGLALVAGGAVLHRSTSGDPCGGSEQALAGVWDAPRKSAVRAVFEASPLPYARGAWSEVERTLDGYSRDWVAASHEACVATRVAGHQPERLLDRRVVCLDQRLKDLAAVVDTLAAADAQVIQNAARAAHGLEGLAPCADIATLASPEPPPLDDETRRRMEDLRTRRATVRAKLNAGQVKLALELAPAVAREAHDVGYGPLEAEVLDLFAETQGQARQYREAIRTLHRAIQAAEASRHDRQAAESWAGLVRLLSFVGADLDPDEETPRHAAAALKRLGGDARIEATLSMNLASLHRARGRMEEALAESHRALDMARKVYTAEEPELATALLSVGQMLGLLGRPEEGLPFLLEAESVYGRTYGPEHPNLAVVLDTIAVHHVQAGAPERALEHGRRALGIFQRVYGDEHPMTAGTLHNLGGFLLELDRAEEALHSFERAAKIREKELGPRDAKLAASLSGMGRALAKQGRYAEAAEHHQRALAIREAALGPESPPVAIDLMGLGRDFLGLKAPRKARAPLERAVALLERQPAGTSDDDLADARFALAQALASEAGELEKARRLADAAREYNRRFPRKRAAELAEIERWMAARAAR
ncbi:serine/threonine-protein kinase [Myxococcus sp. RHSTA-1-4]|uniref:serine/threonine-protein kinase n=1 Tax=Myxococcus sp. RHSTA-1-4 TaxID=2874601 RepID=UPI001CC04BC0|nr:serine/threonine-protein kinase [Myxococcus sp. RHSTA-1-4]MBZ4416485.1 serine/threonine-protein kinase [Myxococcus sp. RHSTA-1-4]